MQSFSSNKPYDSTQSSSYQASSNPSHTKIAKYKLSRWEKAHNSIPIEEPKFPFCNSSHNRMSTNLANLVKNGQLPKKDSEKSELLWEYFIRLRSKGSYEHLIRQAAMPNEIKCLHYILKEITHLDFTSLNEYEDIDIDNYIDHLNSLCTLLSQHYQGSAISFNKIISRDFGERLESLFIQANIHPVFNLIKSNPHLTSISIGGHIFSNYLQKLMDAIKENGSISQLNLSKSSTEIKNIVGLLNLLKENPVPIALNLNGITIEQNSEPCQPGEIELFTHLESHPTLTSFHFDWQDKALSDQCNELMNQKFLYYNSDKLCLAFNCLLKLGIPQDVARLICHALVQSIKFSTYPHHDI